MKKDEIVFYKEWLTLPKEQFRIMIMLAREKQFCGNLTDLCNYFSLSPQKKNRDILKESIEQLSLNNMINCKKSGRTYSLEMVSKESEIKIESNQIEIILSKKFCTSVSKEATIKVLLWLIDIGDEIFTNAQMALELCLSEATVTSAKKVLRQDFNLIVIETEREKINENEYRCLGERVTINAFIKY